MIGAPTAFAAADDRRCRLEVDVGIDVGAVLGPQDEVGLLDGACIDLPTEGHCLAHMVVKHGPPDVHGSHARLRGASLHDGHDGRRGSADCVALKGQGDETGHDCDERRDHRPNSESRAVSGPKGDDCGHHGGPRQSQGKGHSGLTEQHGNLAE